MPDGLVDLLANVLQDGNLCAYALASIDSPIARKAKLWIGSDDGVTVWLNGIKLEEKAVDRGWTPDEDKLEVPLVAGANVILLRVDQAGGDWRFNVKVSEPPSGPLFEGMASEPAAAATGEPPFDAQLWRKYALDHAGDPARGKELFHSEKGPGCFKCHALAGVGPKVGPDLRDVGAKYPRSELITSVLDPSNRILDGYQATNFFLKNGDVVTGLVTSEREGIVTVVDANAVTHELRAADVGERRVSKISAMATGVVEALTREQFADLIAWIESLKK
jgi:putative heme-binding domain-containing protein